MLLYFRNLDQCADCELNLYNIFGSRAKKTFISEIRSMLKALDKNNRLPEYRKNLESITSRYKSLILENPDEIPFRTTGFFPYKSLKLLELTMWMYLKKCNQRILDFSGDSPECIQAYAEYLRHLETQLYEIDKIDRIRNVVRIFLTNIEVASSFNRQGL